MKSRIAVLLCVVTCAAFADESSHRKAASELLATMGSETSLVSGMDAMAGPVEAAWRQQGIPESLIPIMRGAMADWVKEDLKWSDLEPRLVDLYVREFTEGELREIVAFYNTPAGKKAASAIPKLMSEGVAIGQKFAEEKQDLLVARVKKAIAEKQAKDEAKEPLKEHLKEEPK